MTGTFIKPQLFVASSERCLFVVFRPTREYFTHMETSPLPVKVFKCWPMLQCKNNSIWRYHFYSTNKTRCFTAGIFDNIANFHTVVVGLGVPKAGFYFELQYWICYVLFILIVALISWIVFLLVCDWVFLVQTKVISDNA